MSTSTTTESPTNGMPLHTPVCIRFFEEALEEELHRGIVTETHDSFFTLELVNTVSAPVDTFVELYFRDENHKFSRVKATVIDSWQQKQHSTLWMKLISEEGSYAEQRSSFRVSLADQDVKLIVDAHTDCRALDISAEGIGVVTPRAFKEGQKVSVNILFDGQRIDGLMDVRTVRARKDKLFRCGLQVPRKNKDMLAAFQKMSISVQRELLCRLAAISSDAKRMDAQQKAEDRTRLFKAIDDASKRREQAEETAQSIEGYINKDQCVLLRLPLDSGGHVMLPAALLDESGRIVFAAGDEIQSEEFKQLESDPLFMSRSWLKKAGAEPKGDSKDGYESRTFFRREWKMKISVVLEQQDSTRYIAAQTIDLSRGGYSFTATQDVPAGSILTAEVPVGKKLLTVRGTVRHCTKLAEQQYQVGVQFAEVIGAKNMNYDV